MPAGSQGTDAVMFPFKFRNPSSDPLGACCLWGKNLCFRAGQGIRKKGPGSLGGHTGQRPLQHLLRPEEKTLVSPHLTSCIGS